MSDDRQRRITQRAHEIWQREGCPDGRADEHWRRATAEIEAEEAAAVSPAAAVPAPQPAPEEAAKDATKRTTKSRTTSAGKKADGVKAEEPKWRKVIQAAGLQPQ
jgi:hypothetical protein